MKIPMIYTLMSTAMVSALSVNVYASEFNTPTKEDLMKKSNYAPYSPFTAGILAEDERTRIHNEHAIKKQAIAHQANLKMKQEEADKLLNETKAKNTKEMRELEEELERIQLKHANDQLLLEKNKQLKKEVEELKAKSEELEKTHSDAQKEFEQDKEKMNESRKKIVEVLQKSRDLAKIAYDEKVKELESTEIELIEVKGKSAQQAEDIKSLKERYEKLHEKVSTNTQGGAEDWNSDDEDTKLKF